MTEQMPDLEEFFTDPNWYNMYPALVQTMLVTPDEVMPQEEIEIAFDQVKQAMMDGIFEKYGLEGNLTLLLFNALLTTALVTDFTRTVPDKYTTGIDLENLRDILEGNHDEENCGG